jgi:hypothetical protein
VPVPLGLEGVPLGLEVEPLGEELSLGGMVVLDGGVDGDGEDGGDADGDRSPRRSPRRSLRDSPQAASMPTPSTRAQRPVRVLFISEPPPCGVALARRLQRPCPRRLDSVRDNYYQCE